MSLASRARASARAYQDYCDRLLHGFPTYEAFRAWQRTELPRFMARQSPSEVAANLAITAFAAWDGWTINRPSQAELDALSAHEETLTF